MTLASADLETMLAEGRYNELSQTLASSTHGAESPQGLEVLRYRGELAARGWGPFTDVARAAAVLFDAKHRAAPALAAHAVRSLAHAGANETARALLEGAEQLFPGDAGLALTRDQLGSGRAEGATRDAWEALGLVDRGELDRALETLEAMTRAADVDDRLFAHRLLADLRRRSLDFSGAARALEDALRDRPNADDAPAYALSAALARWAAGEVPEAVSALRRLRDETLDARGARGWVHARVVCALDALDADPAARDAGPSFVLAPTPPALPRAFGPGGAGIARLVLGTLGVTDTSLDASALNPRLPTMPHLRRALEQRGVRTIRAIASEEVIATTLEEGGLVVLEEERPVDTGFLLVRGLERVAKLLLLRDAERPGPFLRDTREQRTRSALHGQSALVVLGLAGPDTDARRARLEARGVAHDTRLDAIDQLDLDSDGRTPSQARVVELAHEAMRVASELALPHARLGEALLAQRMRGALARGTFERWYVEARERFPDSEWPLQIYARALGSDGRHEEAGIAWSDAATIDPHDPRNALGMARACVFLGKREDADRYFARASALAPEDARILAERADLAIARSDRDHARLLSQIAVDIDPKNELALLVRATVLEGDDDFEGAKELCARAAALDDKSSLPRKRALRRSLHDGDFVGAAELAASLVETNPTEEETWVAQTDVALATGDGDAMFGGALTGIERVGPSARLVDAAARAIGSFFVDGVAENAVDALCRALANAPTAMLDAASELARHGAIDLAMTLCRSAMSAMPKNPNGAWRTAQILLSDPTARVDRRAEVIALLEATIERAGNYPHPRVLLGLYTLGDDPARALALAEGADARMAPALVWTLYSRAFEALGRADDAERVLARMPELYPNGILEPAGFLRYTRFFETSRALLEGSLAAVDVHVPTMVELALTLSAAGAHEDALALLLRAEARDPNGVPRGIFMDVAEGARNFAALERAAAREVELGQRESGRAYRDVWTARARAAGAALARGSERERDALLARAPNHPHVRIALLRIERALDHRSVAADREALARVAPGAAARGLAERGPW